MSDKIYKNIIPLSLRICHKRGKPMLKILTEQTNPEIIKYVLTCAMEEKPGIFFPRFFNKHQAYNSLMEKGIIYLAEDGEYYFNDF